MKYTIQLKETKVSAKGHSYSVCTLLKEDGSTVDATMFSSFPNYANIMTGHIIEANLKENDYNGKKSYVLDPIMAQSPNSGAYRSSGGMSKMMETKAKNIEEAQNRKSESIAYFNSVNSAITMYRALRELGVAIDNPREEIIKWRDWFLSEYEKWNNDLPTKNPPF
jgi:hypothetical protein